jgi:hypothetical protein
MALLLNKYPSDIINDQFNRVLLKFDYDQLLSVTNYNLIRGKIIQSPIQGITPVDHGKTMFVHFTYCTNMQTFPMKLLQY